MVRDVPKTIEGQEIVLLTKEELNQQPNPLTWHTLNCELITPMYGGGAESTVVDRHMPIRTSSIRGNLRFWWRLLAKHKWKLDDIATKEKDIWGGMGNSDDDGKAGKVLLRVINLSKKRVGDNDLIAYDDGSLSGLRYVLFPAYNETDDSKKPHKLLKSDNVKLDLQVAFAPQIANDDTIKNQIIETLQWWANFGGLGFRSRKGLGAICVNVCQDFPQICHALTNDDVQQADCRLVVRNSNSSTGTQALAAGIQKLSDFRQKAGVGRNEPSDEAKKMKKPAGRSRFPEPDALRRIQRNLGYDKKHEPVHQAGNMFPRASFGLPILFHSHQEKAVNATVNPAIGERLASPLIIRPRKVGSHYQVMALVLPYKDILKMKVEINGMEYPIWEQDKAKHIHPIQENGNDPLDAFLNYFIK